MKLNRDAWTPLTVTVETPEEAEILHKILAMVTDETEERDGEFLTSLFFALGKGIGDADYMVTGGMTLKDYREF